MPDTLGSDGRRRCHRRHRTAPHPSLNASPPCACRPARSCCSLHAVWLLLGIVKACVPPLSSKWRQHCLQRSSHWCASRDKLWAVLPRITGRYQELVLHPTTGRAAVPSSMHQPSFIACRWRPGRRFGRLWKKRWGCSWACWSSSRASSAGGRAHASAGTTMPTSARWAGRMVVLCKR